MDTENNNIAHGSLLTLNDLFKDRKFIIPDYQRGYSWESAQRKDLLDDILFISRTNHTHYAGTIVATQNQNNDFEIVDGQQRLTTLYILLVMILKNSKKNKISKEQIEKIENLIGLGSNRRLVLNKDIDDCFNNTIINNDENYKPKVKAEKNIIAAKNEFKMWLEENDSNLVEIASSIYSRLGFLFFMPENSKEIGIMFEVINNRGKPLSELEKLKNYLIYFAGKFNFDIINNINSMWKTILENLSDCDKTDNEDEDQFLRFCWFLFQKTSKNDRARIFELIKEKYPVNIKYEDRKKRSETEAELNELLEILNKCSYYYRDYINASDPNKNSKNKNLVLEQLSCQPSNAPIMPLYFSICLSLENETEYGSSKTELLQLLEKLNFRVYVCPDVTKRSDAHQTELYSMTYSFREEFNDADNADKKEIVINNLKTWLEKFIRDKSPVVKLVEGLTLDKNEDYDYHKWTGLGYFLFNYEIYLNKKKTLNLSQYLYKMTENLKPLDRIHKEHLWGQKNRVNDGNNRWEDEHQKKRLGNFVLLEGSINSKCSDKALDEKLKIYEGKDTSTFKQVLEIEKLHTDALNHINFKSRNKGAGYFLNLYTVLNDLREERLLKFAIERWGFQDEVKNYPFIKIDSYAEIKRDEVFDVQLFLKTHES